MNLPKAQKWTPTNYIKHDKAVKAYMDKCNSRLTRKELNELNRSIQNKVP
jgi:hypothetical protein